MPWGEVFGPLPERNLQQMAYWADEFLRMLHAALGKDMAAPIRIRVTRGEKFRQYCREQFERYEECGTGEGTYAFYNTETQELAIAFDRGSEADTQRQLAHEITHAYMDLSFGLIGPPWFAEGLADFFSFFFMERQRPISGAVYLDKLWNAKTAFETKTIKTLLKLSWKEYTRQWEPNTDLAWSLIHLIAEKEGLQALVERISKKRTEDLAGYEDELRREIDRLTYAEPPPGYQYGEFISSKARI